MSKIDILKSATDIVVSTGATAVVMNFIKDSTPENAKLAKKISIGVGSFVIARMVAEHTVDYKNKKIDDTVDKVKATKENIAKIKEDLAKAAGNVKDAYAAGEEAIKEDVKPDVASEVN